MISYNDPPMDKLTFSSRLELLLQEAGQLIPREPLPALPARDGIPAWHPHELALWNIGESIRQLILEAKQFPSDIQVKNILAVCRNPAAGRGRQSFVLLLGKVRYACYAEEMASLLADRDISGQVINTLYKMKAPGYADQIQPFLADHQTWIRNEAKRYLQKYQ